MSMILDHVTYEYGTGDALAVKALDDVSLTMEDGQFIGLVGHTGSGKSTLVQLLNGLLKPTAGAVYYDGKDINDSGYDRKALRGKVGLVFQYPEHQLFETTVFKDVCYGPKNLGFSQKDTELRAYEALKMAGLEDDYFYQSPFDLSGGQKRRVAIAGVLAMKPDMLVLDEPTAGLDPKGRNEILELVSRLRRETGITIILVSHSMDDVAEYVDKMMVMNRGKLIFYDSPDVVFTHAEELESMGLGVPQVTDIMKTMKKAGYPVKTDIITIEDACTEILRISGREKDAVK